jgi:hypothetical protein
VKRLRFHFSSIVVTHGGGGSAPAGVPARCGTDLSRATRLMPATGRPPCSRGPCALCQPARRSAAVSQACPSAHASARGLPRLAVPSAAHVSVGGVCGRARTCGSAPSATCPRARPPLASCAGALRAFAFPASSPPLSVGGIVLGRAAILPGAQCACGIVAGGTDRPNACAAHATPRLMVDGPAPLR